MKGLARVLLVLGILALASFAAWRLVPRRTLTDADGGREQSSHLVGAALPRLADAPAWINGSRAIADSLRGHPTVLALWSDTDPECLRALPALEGWHQAYGRHGVRIVGVHEPDFAFAADPAVPARLAARLRLSFPIVLDPTYLIRSRLGVPSDRLRFLLADSSGTIVTAASGYAEMAGIERTLRELLERLHPELAFPADPGLASGSTLGASPRATRAMRVVPLGSARVGDGPLAGATPGRAQAFTAQFRFQVEGKPYVPYPVGLWSPGGEGVTAGRGGAENFIAMRYDGGALWAVLSPPRGETVRVWVLRDERWLPADALGADARRDGRGDSYLEVNEARLYAVCRARGGEHVVKLSPDAPGVVVHALIVEPATIAGPAPE